MLEEDGELSPDDFVRKSSILVELFNMYAEEESYWHQRAHSRWLLQGDSNTSYFHKIANGRKRKNTVHSLDNNGSLIEGTDNLLAHATSYYKELFGPAPGNLFAISPSLWGANELLSDEDNVYLTRPFTEKEVSEALFSMKANRAPGPDNIPTEFYQHCWGVVKSDVMVLFSLTSEGV